MTAPQRIQRKRIKGWRMPANTVYVGRGSKWGNPFLVDSTVLVQPFPGRSDQAVLLGVDRRLAIHMYRSHIIGTFGIQDIRNELGGKNLACWCKLDQPCHADVLLFLANAKDQI